MNGSSFLNTARAEFHRWTRDPVIFLTIAALIALAGMLTYFAVDVATGSASSGSDGVQLQTDIVLDADSTNEQLASMPRSSLTMLIPIAATVLGVQAAGSEMATGALLQLAVAARGLRLLFVVRTVILCVLLGAAGAMSGVATLAATGVGISQTSELAHLSAWHSAGATAQATLIGLIAFGLSAITRRWVMILVGMIVHLVGLEPVLAGLLGEESVWLPRVATSELLVPDPDLAHVVPTVACALAFVATAIWSLRREWATR